MKNIFTILFISAFLLLAGNAFSNTDYNGIVRYNDAVGTPVKSVIVKLYDNFGNLVATETSKSNGKYSFKNINDGPYTIEFSGELAGAKVNSSDAFLLMWRLFGFVRFNPTQELAADVNGDGKVSWADFEAIVTDYFLFGIKHRIGKVVALPKKVEVGGMSLKDGDAGTIGTTGDMEGAFEPSTKTKPLGIKIQYAKSINIRSNELINVPVYLKNQPALGGFVCSFNFPEQVLNIEDIDSQLEGLQYNLSNGKLRVVWQTKVMNGSNIDLNQPLFSLKLRSLSGNEFSEISNLTLDRESHLIDANGIELKDAQLSLPSFGGFEGENELNNIYPNPVYNTATINYSLSSSYKVSLQIYNTVGQLVSNLVDEEQVAGDYEVIFSRANLHLSAGSYIYRLECKGENSFVQSKIMIIR